MIAKETKFQTVIEKNTFYFHNPIFQQKYEGHINSLNETLLVLKNNVETHGVRRELFENLLATKENGLKTLLALTGFANESLKRLITLVRVTNDVELARLLHKDQWAEKTELTDITEWGDSKISNLIQRNEYFRKGIVNLFFEGASVPFLAKTLPLFEIKKLSISKLKFEMPALIDTLIRYKEKGSYSGQAENNPEYLIATILQDQGITFAKGDLPELSKNESVAKRTMDFIIPNKQNPKLIIESSFLVTTSSGQGDKSKTEVNIKTLIDRHYPTAQFIGFIDGVGWYVRRGDLRRMVSAYDDVFTYEASEIERFKCLLKTFSK